MKLTYMAPALELYGSVTALTASSVKCSVGPDSGLHQGFVPGDHITGDIYDGGDTFHLPEGTHGHDPDGCLPIGTGFG